MKKLLALLMAVLMVLSLSAVAFADGEHTTHGNATTPFVSTPSTVPAPTEGNAATGQTKFYGQIDRDATSTGGATITETANVKAANGNWYGINYTVTTKSHLNVTVPLYVCMYAYGGDGSVKVPGSDAYAMRNTSTREVTSRINSITPYYLVTGSGTIKDDGTYKKYTFDSTSDNADSVTCNLNIGTGAQSETEYYLADANMLVRLMAPNESGFVKANNGTSDALFYKGNTIDSATIKGTNSSTGSDDKTWTFVAGTNPGSDPRRDEKDGTFGLGVQVSQIQATELTTDNAGWNLVSANVIGNLKAKQFVLTVNNFDLFDALGKSVDITGRAWTIPAPTSGTQSNPTATSLDLPITAAIAGNSVNEDGHADFVTVTYTIIPGEAGTTGLPTSGS